MPSFATLLFSIKQMDRIDTYPSIVGAMAYPRPACLTTLPLSSLCSKECVTGRQHLHLQLEVDGNLHQDRLAIHTHVVNLWTDIQQNRFDLLEGCFVSTDQQGEVALLEGNYTARDRGIEHLCAF